MYFGRQVQMYWRNVPLSRSILTVDATNFYTHLAPTYKNIVCHIPKTKIFMTQCHENLKISQAQFSIKESCVSKRKLHNFVEFNKTFPYYFLFCLSGNLINLYCVRGPSMNKTLSSPQKLHWVCSQPDFYPVVTKAPCLRYKTGKE